MTEVNALASQRWRRLLPLAFVTYSFAYLDRSNYSLGSAGGLKRLMFWALILWGVFAAMQGVVESYPLLRVDRLLLGLVTGNLEAAAHIKLYRARLNRFFSFGGYGSDSTDRGELTRIALRRAEFVYGQPLTPEQAIVVGDTPHDVRGAHAAGMQCVGVGSHRFNVQQLRDAGADYAIASLEETLPL